MKGNLLCLHLPVLYVHLVSTENNRNVFTDPEEQSTGDNQNILSQLGKKNSIQYIRTKKSTHLQRSLCHVGTFLYVNRAVTSNIMMAHCPWILHRKPKTVIQAAFVRRKHQRNKQYRTGPTKIAKIHNPRSTHTHVIIIST